MREYDRWLRKSALHVVAHVEVPVVDALNEWEKRMPTFSPEEDSRSTLRDGTQWWYRPQLRHSA